MVKKTETISCLSYCGNLIQGTGYKTSGRTIGTKGDRGGGWRGTSGEVDSWRSEAPNTHKPTLAAVLLEKLSQSVLDPPHPGLKPLRRRCPGSAAGIQNSLTPTVTIASNYHTIRAGSKKLLPSIHLLFSTLSSTGRRKATGRGPAEICFQSPSPSNVDPSGEG